MINLTPPNISSKLLMVEQQMERLQEKGCRENALRVMHTLTVVNNCFGVKQRIVIKYSADTDTVRFCDGMGNTKCLNCKGGAVTHEIAFPVAQAYWLGIRKTLVTFICWTPEDDTPDFNLSIEVSSMPFSTGYPPEAIKGMKCESVLCVYVSYEEDGKT